MLLERCLAYSRCCIHIVISIITFCFHSEGMAFLVSSSRLMVHIFPSFGLLVKILHYLLLDLDQSFVMGPGINSELGFQQIPFQSSPTNWKPLWCWSLSWFSSMSWVLSQWAECHCLVHQISPCTALLHGHSLTLVIILQMWAIGHMGTDQETIGVLKKSISVVGGIEVRSHGCVVNRVLFMAQLHTKPDCTPYHCCVS